MPRGYRMGLLLLGDSPSVPDGSTVTPINDVPTWLKCAGIPTTTYTTLAEVLADSSLLRVLINSENAMDYLVRCKEWISLGEGLVPTMTSDTTPSGVCSASSVYSSSYPAWKVFDKDLNVSSSWVSNGTTNQWVKYRFPTEQCVKSVSIYTDFASGGNSAIKNFRVEGSNDDSEFTTIYTGIYLNQSGNQSFSFNNNESYLYYRLYILDRYATTSTTIQFVELQYYDSAEEGVTDSQTAMQFIGANDYAYSTLFADADWKEAMENSAYFEDVLTIKAPIMTSANTPSGIVTQSSIYSNDDGFAGWRAFNGIVVGGSGTIWHSAQSSTTWIQYEFPSNVDFNVRLIKIQDRDSSNIQGTYNVNFKRSSDGEIIKSFSYSPTNGGVHEIVVDNTNSGNICRLEYTNPASPNNYTIIAELNFYGRPNHSGVQSWLLSANITNKNYTTLNQVLADTDTLTALISSHSAMDYLVTCTSWANDICSNQTAMTLIGNDNYASNKLLADSTWLNAICNSTYFESVLNVKVPTMTSDSSNIFSSSISYSEKYYAFDGDDTTATLSSSVGNHTGDYIGYHFSNLITPALFVGKMGANGQSGGANLTYKVRGSLDGTSWNDLTDQNTINGIQNVTNLLNTLTKYDYIEFYVVSGGGANTRFETYTIQFYGRQDV